MTKTMGDVVAWQVDIFPMGKKGVKYESTN